MHKYSQTIIVLFVKKTSVIRVEKISSGFYIHLGKSPLLF